MCIGGVIPGLPDFSKRQEYPPPYAGHLIHRSVIPSKDGTQLTGQEAERWRFESRPDFMLWLGKTGTGTDFIASARPDRDGADR